MASSCVLVRHVHYMSGSLCIFELEAHHINLMVFESFFDETVCQGMRNTLYGIWWIIFIMIDRIVDICIFENCFSMDLGDLHPSQGLTCQL